MQIVAPAPNRAEEVQRTAVLTVDRLSVTYATQAGDLTAVDEVSFSVRENECLAIVGESACGKSTACLALLRLTAGNARITGRAMFGGRDLLSLDRRALDRIRGQDVAMIFQDPIAALNPVHKVGHQVAEVLKLHRGFGNSAALAEARRLFDLVGIPDAGRRLSEYPHQLSGGMNQRVGIAMALASKPRLLIADEPTTALDVTIQAQILDLLRQVQAEFGTALILVTHDLGVVAEMADRVAVMYSGRIVEAASVTDLFTAPLHPYTRGLLGSIPPLAGTVGRLPAIDGTVPAPGSIAIGCRFAPRCGLATPECSATNPPWTTLIADHGAACLRTGAAA